MVILFLTVIHFCQWKGFSTYKWKKQFIIFQRTKPLAVYRHKLGQLVLGNWTLGLDVSVYHHQNQITWKSASTTLSLNYEMRSLIAWRKVMGRNSVVACHAFEERMEYMNFM